MSPSEDITRTYLNIRGHARQIVSRYPTPDFYIDHSEANALSKHGFDFDPVVRDLRRWVMDELQNDLGHGLDHAVKVSLDAGALICVECRRAGFSEAYLRNRIRVVQCAGLLHDIRRMEADHAAAGACFARKILAPYALCPDEIGDICQAIQDHEAFQDRVPVNTAEGRLISNCLYDADKFRWGPDNFADTVWKMVISAQIPLSRFIEKYPRGMERISRVKETFRSHTGRIYGPRFIDLGLAIGNDLYRVIQEEFAHLTECP